MGSPTAGGGQPDRRPPARPRPPVSAPRGRTGQARGRRRWTTPGIGPGPRPTRADLPLLHGRRRRALPARVRLRPFFLLPFGCFRFGVRRDPGRGGAGAPGGSRQSNLNRTAGSIERRRFAVDQSAALDRLQPPFDVPRRAADLSGDRGVGRPAHILPAPGVAGQDEQDRLIERRDGRVVGDRGRERCERRTATPPGPFGLGRRRASGCGGVHECAPRSAVSIRDRKVGAASARISRSSAMRPAFSLLVGGMERRGGEVT